MLACLGITVLRCDTCILRCLARVLCMAAGVLPLWAVPGVQHVPGVLVVHVVDCATMYRRLQSCTMATVDPAINIVHARHMCSTCHCNISV